jgi:hypothetical protein
MGDPEPCPSVSLLSIKSKGPGLAKEHTWHRHRVKPIKWSCLPSSATPAQTWPQLGQEEGELRDLKWFVITSLNPPSNKKHRCVHAPFHTWGNTGSVSLRHSPKSTQLLATYNLEVLDHVIIISGSIQSILYFYIKISTKNMKLQSYLVKRESLNLTFPKTTYLWVI